MNTKNYSSLLFGALLALLPACSSPDGPACLVDAVFPSPAPPAPLVIGPFVANVHRLLAGEEQTYKEQLLDDLVPSDKDKPSLAWDHWNARSISPRMGRFFLNYDSDIDGAKLSTKLTEDRHETYRILVRLFLNNNPGNPFHPEVKINWIH
jgi:hypothetical protein